MSYYDNTVQLKILFLQFYNLKSHSNSSIPYEFLFDLKRIGYSYFS